MLSSGDTVNFLLEVMLLNTVTLFMCNREALRGFRGFPQSLQANSWILPRTDHSRCLAHAFQYISFRSKVYSFFTLRLMTKHCINGYEKPWLSIPTLPYFLEPGKDKPNGIFSSLYERPTFTYTQRHIKSHEISSNL
jgi:hypothetical protein